MISLSLSTPSPETAPRLTPAQRRLVVAILGLFFGTLLAVTTIYLRYPWGNDLDEIGWLVDNLDIRRLESFANQIYPFGFFVLLYVCRAIFGSILFSAFFIQAVAVTALLFFSFRAALTLSQEFATALIALLCTMLFLSSFATTELMDGIPGALVIAGYAMAIEKRRLERSAFIIGLCIGGAFLFRYHYLPLLPISVVAFPLCFRLSWRRSAAVARASIIGFVCTAWPVLVVNVLVRGNPFDTGVSQYQIGYELFRGDLDWRNFLGTYDKWPLSRILSEHPLGLLHRLVVVAKGIVLENRAVQIGLVLTPFAFRPGFRGSRRWLAFLILTFAGYVAVVVLPTRYTDRSFVPVMAVLGIASAVGLQGLVDLLRDRVAAIGRVASPRQLKALGFLLVLLSFRSNAVTQVVKRHDRRIVNEHILDVLSANGMTTSNEVFANDWDIFNLRDPKFISFVNYGGWILLDSKYQRERPRPAAASVQEWDAYFKQQGIRFVILLKLRDAEPLLRNSDAAGLQKLYEDQDWCVFKRVASDIPAWRSDRS